MGPNAVSRGEIKLTRHAQSHWHPSPNFGPRRDGLQPSLIVIHYTAMTSADAALARLCDPETEVSAHYLISAQGQVIQMVREDMRAWHAGAASWCGQDDVNSRSIGIELDNDGATPFAAAQMDALEGALQGIMARWPIPASGVIAHSDVAPGRKADPGPRFDWARLAAQGLARRHGRHLAPPDAGMDRFRALATNIGYTAQVDDQTLLDAVRLRYRPHATGGLSPLDFAPFDPAVVST
jgi:N-acetylmuramoyl-L-alanine amidase